MVRPLASARCSSQDSIDSQGAAQRAPEGLRSWRVWGWCARPPGPVVRQEILGVTSRSLARVGVMGQATRALAGEFGRWRASGGVEPPLESAGSVIDGGGVAVPDCLGGGVADVERPDEVVRPALPTGSAQPA